MKHDQPVMLLTGTSRGIGAFLATYFLEKGYQVVGCSRSEQTVFHENYHHFQLDLANEKEVIELFKFIKAQFQRLDVLINNAAINPAIVGAALLPYSAIENAFRINVFAPMLTCREATKLMMRTRFGRIINLGSMASKHEVAGEALYTATKGALISYSRVLAKEVAKAGITVNVVAPSAIETDLMKQINPDALAEVLRRNAIHELGQLEDVANLIDSLIQPTASAITGQVIYLGGV